MCTGIAAANALPNARLAGESHGGDKREGGEDPGRHGSALALSDGTGGPRLGPETGARDWTLSRLRQKFLASSAASSARWEAAAAMSHSFANRAGMPPCRAAGGVLP